MLADMSRCAERKPAKLIVVDLELPLKFATSVLFLSGQLIEPIGHSAMSIDPKATFGYLGNTPSRR